MCQWRDLHFKGINNLDQMPVAELSCPGELLMSQLLVWAQDRLNGTGQFPAFLFEQMMYKTWRAPVLMMIALRIFDRKLQSFDINISPTASFPLTREEVGLRFNGLDLPLFSHWDYGLEWLCDMFQSLRHLCLCLDNATSRNWRRFIAKPLQAVQRIETLELWLSKAEHFAGLDLPIYPHIKTLKLGRFWFNKGEVEEKLLPWCFQTGLQNLHLVNFEFVVPFPTSATDIVFWLLENDISSLEPESETPNAMQDTTESADPEASVHGDKSNHPAESEDVIEDEEEKWYKFLFGDAEERWTQWPFEMFDFDDDESPHDPEFLPCCPEMWNRHLESRIVDYSADGWENEFVSHYYKNYHHTEEAAYDHDYDNDTPDIWDELPIPPHTAEEVRRMRSVLGASIEFHIHGSSWGYGDRILCMTIDKWSSRHE
ncbi:hypothetical protein EYZ11_007510 [Aspergillus tanneri]|nr:hypothetical protein EYZ11_007510 [Aspergillus tanneri]